VGKAHTGEAGRGGKSLKKKKRGYPGGTGGVNVLVDLQKHLAKALPPQKMGGGLGKRKLFLVEARGGRCGTGMKWKEDSGPGTGGGKLGRKKLSRFWSRHKKRWKAGEMPTTGTRTGNGKGKGGIWSRHPKGNVIKKS